MRIFFIKRSSLVCAEYKRLEKNKNNKDKNNIKHIYICQVIYNT